MPQSEEQFSCEDCGREFNTQRGLSQHQSAGHENYETMACGECGAEFTYYAPDSEQRQYCSQECANKARRGSERPGGWKPNRNEAVDRDEAECQSCGAAGLGMVEAHHLIPRTAGGPNHPKNLITLCPDCHKKAHKRLSEIHQTDPELLDQLREVVTR